MSQKSNINIPLLGKIFQKIAPDIGAKIIMEPKWKIVGQIIFRNGKKRYFRYSSLDLNPLGSSEIAKDKDYANFFMKKMGYPTIPGATFYSDEWRQKINSKKNIKAAYQYAKKIGWPVIIKPNSGSQGTAVAKVKNKQELYRAMRVVFKNDKVALVQKFIAGQDYRIVVLDNKIISAYQRLPFNITGDGTHTIEQLVKQKIKQFIKLERPARLDTADFRINKNLKEHHLSWQSVLAANQKIYLLDNANLSTGGESIDVTADIHPQFKKIAIKLTKDMGLRLCGVDLMIHGDIKKAPKKYYVIEINAAPGLDHYVKTGLEQEKIVENMYLEVLKAMQK
mgnify:CR=1 FL=1